MGLHVALSALLAVAVALADGVGSEAPPLASQAAASQTAVLSGELVEKGTRQALTRARITAHTADVSAQGETDGAGNFSLQLSAGVVQLRIDAPGYKPFVVTETLAPGDDLVVRYLMERTDYMPYETRVVGKRDRTEVSRRSLRGRELTQVPGTFGDPFRVMTTLPGVGQIMSLLGYPLVRGTSPGDTGFLLDGVALPQLFHLFAGPSVVHPEFIDRIDFYPGTFPVRYGGYVGGIVDGITRRVAPDERRLDIDLDLAQAGVFARMPAGDNTSVTVAGRYGYPGLMLGLFHVPFALKYWDYQARLDSNIGGGRLKVFTFGSFDELDIKKDDAMVPSFRQQFHRIDLGFAQGDDIDYATYQLILGFDETLTGSDNPSDLRVLRLAPRLRAGKALSDAVRLDTGLDAEGQLFAGTLNALGPDGQEALQAQLTSQFIGLGIFAEVPVWLTDDWLLTPGLRFDLYRNSPTAISGGERPALYLGSAALENSLGPRLAARLRVASFDLGDVWLKAGVGRYAQPSRPSVPIPGLDVINLERGLIGAWQAMLGAETPILPGIDIDVQAYANYLEPLLFDLTVNNPATATVDGINTVPVALAGRSYGLEVFLRQRDVGDVFGWLSYTLSRTERRYGNTWLPFDFDRTHMLHAVLGWRLPRNWQIGGQVSLDSGRPYVQAGMYNTGRSNGFYRIDLRIDKRAVWNTWLLDFYVDVLNVTLSPEPLNVAGDSRAVRYILPVVGFRALF